uniref:Maff2 family mobile element protein n=1 Tax=Ruminococcus bromii TaxID=40518 RepID=UPI00402714AF
DTMRKCRIGTAKFFTLLLLLYHTSIKSQGMKQLMAGIALIAAGVLLVPVLGQMMNQAQSK